MGTSLNGLTPKDTYPALLKTSDNTALSATAKTISDGSGNDSALSLSTSLVGIGTTTGTARLQVKGSGATSATTSLLVQNSSGTAALTITDDLTATFGGTIGSGGSANFVIAAGNAAVNITSANPQNSSGSLITTGDITRTDSGTKNIINVNNGVSSTAASFGTLNGYAFTSTINQTLGTIRGLYIAPTITASTDFRAIETSVGNVLLGTTSGNFSIGTTATTARTTIKGSGSTSATTSLLVQNSASAAALTITDDLSITTGGQITAQNTFNANYINMQNTGIYNGEYFSLSGTGGRMGATGIVTGASTINASAILQADSTTQGFLPPRMTTAQKNAIATPTAGLVVYDSTLNKLCVRTVATWETITSV